MAKMKQIRKIKELNIWRFFILLLFHFLRFHPPAHLSSLIFQEGCECWESKNSVPEWPWVPRSHTERHHAITAGAMAWEPGSSGSVPRPAADVLCDWEAQSLLGCIPRGIFQEEIFRYLGIPGIQSKLSTQSCLVGNTPGMRPSVSEARRHLRVD